MCMFMKFQNLQCTVVEDIIGRGMPVVHPNGSIEVSDGMVRDINLGKADLIMASISILYNR